MEPWREVGREFFMAVVVDPERAVSSDSYLGNLITAWHAGLSELTKYR